MKVPLWITFTGLDSRTDLKRAKQLAERYPIEWGVLFGGRLGKNRYPDAHTVGAIITSEITSLSMHLCKDLAKAANAGIPPLNFQAFKRIQVNLDSSSYNFEDLRKLGMNTGRYIIVQHRTQTFPKDLSFIQWLQDQSGGRGKTPSSWAAPSYENQLVGYAGGLNPDNVAAEIEKMPAAKFWIDMETGVRTDDWLDLDKCEAVCRAVYDSYR